MNQPLRTDLHVRPGDPVFPRPRPGAAPSLAALRPGWRLWLLADGTGLAPFAGLLRDPATWARYARIVVLHAAPSAAELADGRDIVAATAADPRLGAAVAGRLHYLPGAAPGAAPGAGDIADLLASGRAFTALRQPGPLAPETDRAIARGPRTFTREIAGLLGGWGLRPGSAAQPGDYALTETDAG